MADCELRSATAHTAIALLALGLGLICGASGVDAQERRSSNRGQRLTQEITDFVLGNVEFLLLHELAHFLIEEKEIPIIGPEENAADYLATMALLRTEPFEAGHEDQTLDFLFAAANAFAASWKLGSAIGAEIPYWGNHALGIQRYYQIACLIYGSNPSAFAYVPGTTGLPATRADHCVAEFEQANKSVDWLLETYGRQPGDSRGVDMELVYENPPTSVSRALVEQIRRARLFDLTLERLEELFVLEMPFVLAVRDCDVPEAAWIAERRELVVCYELIETIYLLSLP
jgi:hypothetical protein